MLRFHRGHFCVATPVFAIEACIALYVHDSFVRPYVGDVLVIPLIYCSVATFLATHPVRLGLSVLAFAFAVELGQYFHLVDRLGLQDNTLARTVIGHAYSPFDLLAYSIGALLTVGVHLALTCRADSL